MTALQSQVPSNSQDSFKNLFESTPDRADGMNEGDIVTGTVVKIGKDSVVVDIGYKSEGVIPIAEFLDAAGETHVAEGDKVDVLVESREGDDGLVLLSKEKADRLKVWDEISEACERNEIVEGIITSRVKGGLSVTIRGGVKAFLPGSQVDLRPVRNLDKLLNQSFPFKVIKFNKKRGNIVLSRRALLEQERSSLKAQTLEHLQEGMIVTGTIKNITEYGAFVDLGGIDGLLHITDMSWGRVNHPSEVFKVGSQVTVKVLKYDPEKERVSLGLKQTTDDPWENVDQRYAVGNRVKGKVVSLTDYGAFLEMEEGIEGLIHVSEMSWKKPKHPSKLLEVGQEVECVVLDVDSKNKRISLGLKQLEVDPWVAFTQKYSAGDVIRGVVRSVTDYGVFVGIEDGVDGMVHKSDLSWTQRIHNPAELYHKGDEVEAIILSINHEEKKVSLGIKQLYEDPWTRIPQEYPVGTVLEVRLIGLTESGAYAEIERGVEGLIPHQELGSAHQEEQLQKEIQEGKIVQALVISLDPAQRFVGLSLKALEGREGTTDALKYEERAGRPAAPPVSQGKSGATLGDLLKDKLGDKLNELTKN
jgi:small subunit ribosomal protein S1